MRWCISSPIRSACAISGPERDAAARPEGGAEERAGLGGQPRQPLDHALVVGAEAQHAAEPLVDGGEGAVAVRRLTTTNTGIDGVTMPVIGPAAPRE